MPILNFSSARAFLDIIEQLLTLPDVKQNFLANSVNPIMNMILVYEMLEGILKKFQSLTTQCRAIKATIINYMLIYIEQVDDENFLTHLMLDKDYEKRDSLKIAAEL